MTAIKYSADNVSKRSRAQLVDREEVLRCIRALVVQDGVVEVRALDARLGNEYRPLNYSGYFDDPDKLADAVAQIREAAGIYITLNVVDPALLGRSYNKLRVAPKDGTTGDHHIQARRWLLIDCDAVRASGIAASDDEHDAALELAQRLRDWLVCDLGLPEPIEADSGNGGHLLLRICLPVDDNALVKKVLEGLAHKWNTDQVHIDLKVFNPARISRLYGCLNGKGDPEAAEIGRPHRRARMLYVPDEIVPVSEEQLQLLAALRPAEASTDEHGPSATDDDQNPLEGFDLANWIEEHKLDVTGPEPWNGDGKCWVFNKCPWNPEHENGSAYIVQHAHGGIGAGCHHNSCADKDWHALRDVIEPGWRKKKASKQGIVKRLADAICHESSFAQDAGTKLYVFREGAYHAQGAEFVRRRVKRLLNDWKRVGSWSPHLANEVIEYIRVDSRQLWERPPLDVVNMRNGLLRLTDSSLVPHSPDFLSPVQLPVLYDPKATCPDIERFVGQVFPEDATELAWEIPAYLMTPSTSIQKAVLLIGPGGNGKSTWLAMLLNFLGKANTSGVSLHKLESDRFAASRLYGKLANICPDLPSEHLAGTSVFKAITGGDVLTGEYKFKDSFDFVPFSRLVFSANSPPRSEDSSQGFFERWLVIPFERSFRNTDQEIPREVLDARLATESELSGLLNKAIAAWSRLQGCRRFTRPESTVRAGCEFQATTDPLAVWLDRSTVDDPHAFVVKKTLRSSFFSYLEQRGLPLMTETAFGTSFAKLRPVVESKQRTVNGKPQWCYVGIGLVSDPLAGSQTSQG